VSPASRWLPGLATVRAYERSWLRADVGAGVVLTALLVPAGMGYAQAAGLPAVSGLHASVVPLLVYAVVGPSRILVLGPDSSLVPLVAAAVLPAAAGEPERALALAGLMAILVGGFMLLGGVLRLGTVSDLLSKPIRTGYLAGIAAVVAVGQLGPLVGADVDRDGWWATLRATVETVAEGGADGHAAAVGLASIAVIVLARRTRFGPAGLVAAVGGSMALVAVAGWADELDVVGRLPAGLPAPALGGLGWADVGTLVGPAAATALIAFADTSVLSRTLAARRGEHVDGSRELVAVGAANVGTGLLGGFPISASSSRTPVAEQAGARTQLAGVVGAALILVVVTAGRGLTSVLPVATLAAVVLMAVASLVDLGELARLARMSRTELGLALATATGVVLLGVLRGIVAAVVLSVVVFVNRAWRPYTAELVRVERMKGYHDVDRHPDGRRVPGLVLARFDAPLFFANAAHFGEVVRRYVERSDPPVRWVVVAAEAITGIDTTAVDELVVLDDHLQRHGIHLVFAEMKGPVKDRFAHFGLGERFGPARFFPTIGTAVDAYVAATGTEWVDWEERQDPTDLPG